MSPIPWTSPCPCRPVCVPRRVRCRCNPAASYRFQGLSLPRRERVAASAPAKDSRERPASDLALQSKAVLLNPQPLRCSAQTGLTLILPAVRPPAKARLCEDWAAAAQRSADNRTAREEPDPAYVTYFTCKKARSSLEDYGSASLRLPW